MLYNTVLSSAGARSIRQCRLLCVIIENAGTTIGVLYKILLFYKWKRFIVVLLCSCYWGSWEEIKVNIAHGEVGLARLKLGKLKEALQGACSGFHRVPATAMVSSCVDRTVFTNFDELYGMRRCGNANKFITVTCRYLSLYMFTSSSIVPLSGSLSKQY